MLIAFISDIHGNLPALKAAIGDAKARGVNQIICAGDVTGNGPFPSEVCSYLEENDIPSISGNYDCKVLDVMQGESAAAKLQKKKRELLIWTAKHIKKCRHFLEGLPSTRKRNYRAGASYWWCTAVPFPTMTIFIRVLPPKLLRRSWEIHTRILWSAGTPIYRL